MDGCKDKGKRYIKMGNRSIEEGEKEKKEGESGETLPGVALAPDKAVLVEEG